MIKKTKHQRDKEQKWEIKDKNRKLKLGGKKVKQQQQKKN